MLVHPNPMERQKDGSWEDAHTGLVQVRFYMLNSGIHRKRWAVYHRKNKKAPFELQTRHITPEMAVVSAQTLANRIYRQLKKKKRK